MTFPDLFLSKLSRWFVLGLIGVTAVALQFSLPAPWPQLLAFLLIFVWPIWGWVRYLSGPLLERLALGAALVVVLDVLLVLLLVYLPGPLVRPYQLIGHILLAVLPLFLRPQSQTIETGKGIGWLVLLLVLLTIGLRFWNLGYSEFQGDEGVIMVRAASIISGDDAELFLHQKGPVEILLPLSLWNLAGSIDEFWARLPFAWASVLAVLAVTVLAWRWFDFEIGFWAGMSLSITGFAVAFGRIVQYQSLVMVWGILAVLAAARYAAEKRTGDLWLTAVFIAAGLLAHYDAVLVVPAIGWVLFHDLWRTRRFDWRAWVGSVALGALILAVFYLPYVANPNIGRTGRYLIQGRLGAGDGRGLLSWSGTAVWQMVTFYNSLYFAVGLILLLGVAGLFLWRQRSHLGAVLLFAVPLLFYLFIVADPRTHVYTFFPGAVLLAAVGWALLWQKVKAGNGRYPLLLFFAAFFLVSTNYVYLMFVDHTLERQRNWTETSPAGYLVTWDEPPLYGLFGFPHQAGWRVVKDLLPVDAYPYASNEEKEITNVYMEQMPRTHCANFNTFVLAENAQDEIPYDPAWLDGLFLQAQVLVNGRSSLQVYGRQPVSETQIVDAADLKQWFTPVQVVPARRTGAHPLNITLGDGAVKLLGFDIDGLQKKPGDQIVVTLYWESLVSISRNYQTFVHLYDGQNEELLAQHDGAPDCNMNPTTQWEPGQIIADTHILIIPQDSMAGTSHLLTGMYDLITGERLAIPSVSDNLVTLTEIEITNSAHD
ncbi:MAG: glycosyltransferase family 39 protein [Ardenticatenaceae bacterium]|nr:glycosyltransferase family 39 protein [Ardenticatenaceae bacterium]